MSSIDRKFAVRVEVSNSQMHPYFSYTVPLMKLYQLSLTEKVRYRPIKSLSTDPIFHPVSSTNIPHIVFSEETGLYIQYVSSAKITVLLISSHSRDLASHYKIERMPSFVSFGLYSLKVPIPKSSTFSVPTI